MPGGWLCGLRQVTWCEDTPGFNFGLPLVTRVALETSLNCPVPQFLHPQNGASNGSYCPPHIRSVCHLFTIPSLGRGIFAPSAFLGTGSPHLLSPSALLVFLPQD